MFLAFSHNLDFQENKKCRFHFFSSGVIVMSMSCIHQQPAVWQDVASALAAVDSMIGSAGDSGFGEEFENSKRKGNSLVEERLAKRRAEKAAKKTLAGQSLVGYKPGQAP